MKQQKNIGGTHKRERGSVSAELALFLAAIIIPAVQFLSNGALINFMNEVPQKESSAMMAAHSTPLTIEIDFNLLSVPQPQSFLLNNVNGVTPEQELARLGAIALGNNDPAQSSRCFAFIEILNVQNPPPPYPYYLTHTYENAVCDNASIPECDNKAIELFERVPSPTYGVYLCSWTTAQSLPADPIVSKVLIEL